MEEHEKYIEALIELHHGVERKGPGDLAFSKFIIEQLPPLPDTPRIADIGCGSGVATLFLAETFQSKVKAVDFSRVFLEELTQNATQKRLEHLIETIECDMAALGWEPGSIDLLWSEGAAYNITFEGALKAWRPLLSTNGIAVISEMNYFADDAPSIVKEYMKEAYPGIKTEQENVDLINTSGYETISIHRLPAKAWWDNYYDPLRQKMDTLKNSSDQIMQAVIAETEKEMHFFQTHEQDFGYTFYIMKAV